MSFYDINSLFWRNNPEVSVINSLRYKNLLYVISMWCDYIMIQRFQKFYSNLHKHHSNIQIKSHVLRQIRQDMLRERYKKSKETTTKVCCPISCYWADFGVVDLLPMHDNHHPIHAFYFADHAYSNNVFCYYLLKPFQCLFEKNLRCHENCR